MKTIELKTWLNVIPMNAENSKPIDVTSKELILQSIKNIPLGHGVTTSQMRARFKIMDKAEASKGKTLQLDDVEYNELLMAVKHANWLGIHRCFTEFEDSIVKAGK